jgi:NCS1 family nucleobase:cation symporter-1
VVGLLIFPWKLLANASGFIFTWLVGYSALLGPILITD